MSGAVDEKKRVETPNESILIEGVSHASLQASSYMYDRLPPFVTPGYLNPFRLVRQVCRRIFCPGSPPHPVDQLHEGSYRCKPVEVFLNIGTHYVSLGSLSVADHLECISFPVYKQEHSLENLS